MPKAACGNHWSQEELIIRQNDLTDCSVLCKHSLYWASRIYQELGACLMSVVHCPPSKSVLAPQDSEGVRNSKKKEKADVGNKEQKNAWKWLIWAIHYQTLGRPMIWKTRSQERNTWLWEHPLLNMTLRKASLRLRTRVRHQKWKRSPEISNLLLFPLDALINFWCVLSAKLHRFPDCRAPVQHCCRQIIIYCLKMWCDRLSNLCIYHKLGIILAITEKHLYEQYEEKLNFLRIFFSLQVPAVCRIEGFVLPHNSRTCVDEENRKYLNRNVQRKNKLKVLKVEGNWRKWGM